MDNCLDLNLGHISKFVGEGLTLHVAATIVRSQYILKSWEIIKLARIEIDIGLLLTTF